MKMDRRKFLTARVYDGLLFVPVDGRSIRAQPPVSSGMYPA